MTPVIPLRDTVMFPGAVTPLYIGRPESMAAVNLAGKSDEKLAFAVAQRQSDTDNPGPEDLFAVGTVCRLLQVIHMPNGALKVLLEGLRRFRARSFVLSDGMMSADLVTDRFETCEPARLEALRRAAEEEYIRYVDLHPRMPEELKAYLSSQSDPDKAADLMAFHNDLSREVRQSLLECFSPESRLKLLLRHLMEEVEMLRLKKDVQVKTAAQISEKQKEYFLREQLQVINSELGGSDESEYKEKIDSADLPDGVRKVLQRENARLGTMAPLSPESSVVRTYMDWLLDLPWNKTAKENDDLASVRSVLEKNHYGLQKVKDRLVEFVAVRILAKSSAQAQILCLVGPPGVGKTSLGQSVAQALGRPFVSFSLGGMRDEAEIRGHRRTYIGALPGRIIQKIREAGAKNPVMLLDEVDKLGSDFRGDPASALLEVLDPEQNAHFTDHYLEVPFDLSDVLFITTANVTHTIPSPLLDRMELIELASYLPEEKEQIARRHLIPKLYSQTGMTKAELKITPQAVREIIKGYTHEAGVRELNRKLATIFRKRAVSVLEEQADGSKRSVTVRKADLGELLGAPRLKDSRLPKTPEAGYAIGLAWTAAGGDVLVIEAANSKGKDVLTLTGNLGAVMQESAQTALGYLKAQWKHLTKRPVPNWSQAALHVHVPEGAIPKDGPSAGVTIATALFSALTGRPFRPDRAMTGEISLRGQVLPVGGLREKILAARRAGLKAVALPQANEPDILDLEPWVTEGVELTFIDTLSQALSWAIGDE